MAGRSPKDLAERNTTVLQVCLPKNQAHEIRRLARSSEYKTVSVWMRAQLERILQTVA